MIYVTGDTHGEFDRIFSFCEDHPELSAEDVMIILGDAGVNYYEDQRDKELKERIATLSLTLFMIHGNHEARPETVEGYIEQEWRGGRVYVQPEYPNLLFAKDGEIFDLDEQPSKPIKAYVESRLDRENWQVDAVLSHTCPARYTPYEMFHPSNDGQSTIDTSTEDWLDTIEAKLTYSHWLCGHYHGNKKVDNMQFLYEDIIEWPGAGREGGDDV